MAAAVTRTGTDKVGRLKRRRTPGGFAATRGTITLDSRPDLPNGAVSV
jgi:hypothetical protein